METSVNVEKFYSWERDNDDPIFGDGWKSNIADVAHSDLAMLHQSGIAQEFWVRGEGDPVTVEG